MGLNVDDSVLVSSHLTFGIPDKRDILAWADEKLNRGEDVPVMSALLYESASDKAYRDNLVSYLASRQQALPTHQALGMWAAKYLADKMLKSELSPYEAAKNIWFLIASNETFDDEFTCLRVFSGLVSEFDDFSDEEHIEFYGQRVCENRKADIEKTILSEARQLLEGIGVR